jgi:hypothetical protein
MITAKIARDPCVLILTLSGTVDSAEILACLKNLVSLEGYFPGIRTIHDIRGLSAFPDVPEWDLLAETAGQASEGIVPRRATVVSRAVVFGTQRMFDLLHEDSIGENVAVFYSWQDALEWLGIEPGTLPDPMAQGSSGDRAPEHPFGEAESVET